MVKKFTRYLVETQQHDLLNISAQEIKQAFMGIETSRDDECVSIFVPVVNSGSLCNGLVALGYVLQGDNDKVNSGMDYIWCKGAVSVGGERSARLANGTQADGFNLYIAADAQAISSKGYPLVDVQPIQSLSSTGEA